jgi:hypothetical protein
MPPQVGQGQNLRPSVRERIIASALYVALLSTFVVPIAIGLATGFDERLAVTHKKEIESAVRRCTKLALVTVREVSPPVEEIRLDGGPGPYYRRASRSRPAVLTGSGQYREGAIWREFSYECQPGGLRPKFTWTMIGSAA